MTAIHKDADRLETTEEVNAQGWAWGDRRGLNAKVGNVKFNLLPDDKVYRVEVSGKFVYDTSIPGREADADCFLDPTRTDRATRWTANWSLVAGAPDSDGLLDVKVAQGGTEQLLDWIPIKPMDSTQGDPRCSADHTYFTTITTIKAGTGLLPVTFSINETEFSDNSGDQITITVFRKPIVLPQREWVGKKYMCPRWKNDKTSQFDYKKTVGALQTADVKIDAHDDPQEILNPSDLSAKDIYDVNLNSRTDDRLPHFGEAGHWGVYTCNFALPDTTYRITASGTWWFVTYTYMAGVKSAWFEKNGATFAAFPALADAECAQGAREHDLAKFTEPVVVAQGESLGKAWLDQRYTDTSNPGVVIDYLDVELNHGQIDWKPAPGTEFAPQAPPGAAHSSRGQCSSTHVYSALWTPLTPPQGGTAQWGAGPMLVRVKDLRQGALYLENDNQGVVTVQIRKVAPVTPDGIGPPASAPAEQVQLPTNALPVTGRLPPLAQGLLILALAAILTRLAMAPARCRLKLQSKRR